MKGQSRLASAFEQVANITSGFMLSLVVWQIVGPWYGYDVTLADNVGITTIFTCVSLLRGYVWRRYFNHRMLRRVS